MSSGGFRYTDVGDTARCDTCGLEVSGWTFDMKPFPIHAQRSPRCAYVRSILPDGIIPVPRTINLLTTTPETSYDEKPTKRQKTETTQEICQPTKLQKREAIQEIYQPNILVEINMMKQIRKRTFSQWPHRTSPSSAQMIEAGFFSCNVGDRVICLYCNLICQQWVPNTDDPGKVHEAFSPKCPYVIAMLKHQQTPLLTNANVSQEDQEARHQKYADPKMRYTSFATWPDKNLLSVVDLARAGFFYTGTKTILACFYCNGTLDNWKVNDHPTIERARWFPHCAYAKQLCGDELHRIIQKENRRREEHNNNHELNIQLKSSDISSDSQSLQPSGNDELSHRIRALVDLHASRSLLDRDFELSIINRCWEDQLLSINGDFTSDSELFIACKIRKKQIELGVEEGNNIIIPSHHTSEHREREQTGIQ